MGVVAFDAKSGRPVSFNREMRRIVESLRMPGCPPEQHREVLSFRRADGRAFSLSEVPVAQLLSGRETPRVGEMTLSVPDGCRVRTLVNATPIPSEGDAVGSMVATVQDLAPLNEIERLRTEFLGLVSHESREPLAAIMGSAATLLEEAPTLDPAEMREFHRSIGEQADHVRGLIGDLLDAGRIAAGTLSVSPEPSDAAGLVERARATFLGGGARHGVVVDLPPDLPQVMADRRRVVQVLNNLLSNAARNAPESTEIRVSAVRENDHVSISVFDEGRGLAPERVAHLCRKRAVPGPEDARAGRRTTGWALRSERALWRLTAGASGRRSAGPGRGATVVLTLPAADEAGGKARGASRRPSRPSGEGSGPARVLVVDDDPQTPRLVRDALFSAGYAPVVTGDPGEIKRILRVERPALVVLGLALPGADGVELMTEIPELADLLQFPDSVRSGRQISSRIVSCTDWRISGTVREAGTALVRFPFPGRRPFQGESTRTGRLIRNAWHPVAGCDRPCLRTRKGVARANGSLPGRGRATADPIRNEACRDARLDVCPNRSEGAAP